MIQRSRRRQSLVRGQPVPSGPPDPEVIAAGIQGAGVNIPHTEDEQRPHTTNGASEELRKVTLQNLKFRFT